MYDDANAGYVLCVLFLCLLGQSSCVLVYRMTIDWVIQANLLTVAPTLSAIQDWNASRKEISYFFFVFHCMLNKRKFIEGPARHGNPPKSWVVMGSRESWLNVVIECFEQRCGTRES